MKKITKLQQWAEGNKTRYSIHIVVNDSIEERCISTTRLGLEGFSSDAEHIVIKLLKYYLRLKADQKP